MNCRFCKETITMLDNLKSKTDFCSIDLKGKIVHNSEDSWEHNIYKCPECNEVLAFDKENALKLIESDDI